MCTCVFMPVFKSFACYLGKIFLIILYAVKTYFRLCIDKAEVFSTHSYVINNKGPIALCGFEWLLYTFIFLVHIVI